MRFGEVVEALMAGGGNAVRRGEWCGTFLRYSELWNTFELHGAGGRVTQLEELNLSPGDLFADDGFVVVKYALFVFKSSLSVTAFVSFIILSNPMMFVNGARTI